MMNNIFTIVLAGVLSMFSGTTFTKVMGKEETRENLVLNVETDGNEKSVSLSGYSVLNYKNVSITGVVTVDEAGNITGFRDAKVVGAPAKVKTAVGVLSDRKADITLTGKAGGIFDFSVHYQASPVK